MDTITAQLDGIQQRIERLEARRDVPGISDARYVALTNEMTALQNRAAALATQAAAQFPAGMMNFSQRNYLPMPLFNESPSPAICWLKHFTCCALNPMSFCVRFITPIINQFYFALNL